MRQKIINHLQRCRQVACAARSTRRLVYTQCNCSCIHSSRIVYAQLSAKSTEMCIHICSIFVHAQLVYTLCSQSTDCAYTTRALCMHNSARSRRKCVYTSRNRQNCVYTSDAFLCIHKSQRVWPLNLCHSACVVADGTCLACRTGRCALAHAWKI